MQTTWGPPSLGEKKLDALGNYLSAGQKEGGEKEWWEKKKNCSHTEQIWERGGKREPTRRGVYVKSRPQEGLPKRRRKLGAANEKKKPPGTKEVPTIATTTGRCPPPEETNKNTKRN